LYGSAESIDVQSDERRSGKLRRRNVLGGAAVGTVALAGCSSLPFFGDCQAEDTSIEEQARNPEEYFRDDNQTMVVVGEADDTTADRVILDDGSGTAAITSGALYEWEGVATGCQEARGSYNEFNQDEYDADLVITNGELTDQ
jgi:hypothetical protein